MASKDDLTAIELSLSQVERYVRTHRYRGFDPYDALMSPMVQALPGAMAKVAVTQLLVYSPLDVREWLGISPGLNPKALALFISGYRDLLRAGMMDRGQFSLVTGELVDHLKKCRSPGFSNPCWGFDFPWQDITRYSPAGLPTVVVTSFAGNALLDLHEITGDQEVLDLAMGTIDFILNELHVHEDGTGICFSYTPIDHHVVHNANMLAADLLSRAYSVSGRADLLERATRAVDFTVSHQEADGSWAYSIDPASGRKRLQIDFHQGFILDALANFIRFSGTTESRYAGALRRGANFYRERQFDPSGRAYWRLPRKWPADIHHQAQGVATFARLGEKEVATRVARWTVDNMQRPDGAFTFQCFKGLQNCIPYMRWGQAWMFYALARLMAMTKEQDGDRRPPLSK